MYFGNYGRRKPWLDKCLKRPAFEDPLKSSMFIDQCEDN